jgi:RNA polymerase sigma-54 factor
VKPGLSQSASLRQELKVNPRLYQAMDLLYMPLLDLQQHLKQELLVNHILFNIRNSHSLTVRYTIYI